MNDIKKLLEERVENSRANLSVNFGKEVCDVQIQGDPVGQIIAATMLLQGIARVHKKSLDEIIGLIKGCSSVVKGITCESPEQAAVMKEMIKQGFTPDTKK